MPDNCKCGEPATFRLEPQPRFGHIPTVPDRFACDTHLPEVIREASTLGIKPDLLEFVHKHEVLVTTLPDDD